jgi:hypothetical protein
MILVGGCASHTGQKESKQISAVQAQSADNSKVKVSPVDGVYEFVSRTTTVTAPQQSTEQLTAPEWYGLWVFHDGYFSQTRMKNIRPDWTPSRFPSEPQGLGFDGSSGTYAVKDGTIELKHMVNFYPGRIGAVEDLTYHFDGDMLTLTLDLLPGPESRATGRRVTVLRKIK